MPFQPLLFTNVQRLSRNGGDTGTNSCPEHEKNVILVQILAPVSRFIETCLSCGRPAKQFPYKTEGRGKKQLARAEERKQEETPPHFYRSWFQTCRASRQRLTGWAESGATALNLVIVNEIGLEVRPRFPARSRARWISNCSIFMPHRLLSVLQVARLGRRQTTVASENLVKQTYL
ncbi:hypothetical protein RRG08_009480 [Elysia crispata]|uniref:Uncharacterized protein n=1 Tax=Elysia crispata TaxID=231223 RepID=A0AAE1ATQ2_9GAST|nr:hypothetical protein RRG08_009480 [Elysia crispata]